MAARDNEALVLVKEDLPALTYDYLYWRLLTTNKVTAFGGGGAISSYLLNSITSEKLDFGTLDDQTYTNQYFGLKVDIPNNWNAGAIINDDDIGYTLLNIYKSRIDDYSIFQIAEVLSGAGATSWDLSDAVKKEFNGSSIKCTFPKDIYTEKIGGINFDVLEIEFKLNNTLPLHIKFCSADLKGYFLTFQYAYTSSESEADLDDVVSSIEFSDDTKNAEAYYENSNLLFNEGK